MFRFFIGGPSYATKFLAQAGLIEKTKKDKSWPPTETAVIQAENISKLQAQGTGEKVGVGSGRSVCMM